MFSRKVSGTAKEAKLDCLALCGIQAAYWSICTMQTSFLVSYLTNNGYSSTFAAVIVFMTAIVNLIAQPMWGYLADSKVGIKRVIVCCMCVSIPAIAFIPLAISNTFLIVFLTVLYGFFMNPMQGLTDALTNLAAVRNRYVVFGFTRGCGSLAAAFSSLLFGKFVSIAGIETVFYINAALCLLILILMLLFKGISYGKSKLDQEESNQHITIKQASSVLLKNPHFILLMICITLLNIPSRMSYVYTPLMIYRFGGGSVELGMAIFLNCILVAPCMVFHSFLIRKKINNCIPLFLSGLFAALRIYCMGTVQSLTAFVAIQILQSFADGLMQPATVQAVSEISPLNFRSTAISIVTAVQVLFSTLIGNQLASAVNDTMGPFFACFCSAILALSGLLFYLPAFLKLKKPKRTS